MKHLCLLGFFRCTLVWSSDLEIAAAPPKCHLSINREKPHDLSKYVTSPYQHGDTTPLPISFQKKN